MSAPTAALFSSRATLDRRLARPPTDPIVEEIHAIREALSKASDHDIRKIAEVAKARQVQSGKKAVRLPPRKTKPEQKAS